MGFIERLEQEELTQRQQLKDRREAREREQLQREVDEKAHHAQRKQQAEKFWEESGVGVVVAKLDEFIARFKRRGSREKPTSVGDLPVSQRDPDSVLDIALWDGVYTSGSSEVRVLVNATHYSEKYIAVESCPDGTIVFHGNWRGSTTIRETEWRSEDKEQIFDRALEKAFKHPGFYKRPFSLPEAFTS